MPVVTDMPPVTDVVIVVPGIMGSELVSRTDPNDVAWGFSGRLLVEAWRTKQMQRLHVTDADLAGKGMLTARRLLRRPALMPILGGLEPYAALINHLEDKLIDKRAVVEFPYDWRLPVNLSGQLLARRCGEVLDTWRGIVKKEGCVDPAEVQVTIVAHSMGGLVARHATEVFGAKEVVRRVLTLGTPHFGAVKAVQMLATGEGIDAHLPVLGDVELPRRLRPVAQALAQACPAMYDLLPRYRCVTNTDLDAGPNTRYLTDDDVAAVGADRTLAADARQRHETLVASESGGETSPILALVGADQPTIQSLTLSEGKCEFHMSICGEDQGGDSTVYRRAAAPLGASAFPLPQRHGALAKSSEAFTFVMDKLRGADMGPPLGTRSISADIPDLASAGKPVTISVSERDRLTGAPLDPKGLTVTSTDVDTGLEHWWGYGRRHEDRFIFTSLVHGPGLYRITVSAGGSSPVSDLMMVDNVPPPRG